MDLFLVSRADIFAIYPKILREILEKDEQKRAKVGYLPKDHVQLPSDMDFQDRVYYRLLAVQRAINEQVDSGKTLEEIAATKEKRMWDPEVFTFSIQSTPTGNDAALRIQRRCRADNPMDFLNPDFLHVWQLDDLIKAAHLLRPKCLEPPDVQKCEFLDEHEMRRVYSMIYDVFRYKHIIDQSLQNIGFYSRYPDMKFDESRIWLLVYDLHLRNFEDRDSADRIRQQTLYESVHVQVLHEHIWRHKINLAASFSRMRIQNGALHLSKLLPIHLQDDKVAVAAAVSMVTGWINPFKLTSKPLAIDALAAYGLHECPDTDDGQVPLRPLHFKWDRVCPLFIGCVPADRGRFSRTALVRDDHFVMQDRAFTYGPAVFCRLLGLFDIDGDIVQTHVSSPRSTAYLAALVHQNSRVRALLAFGAGARLPEYRAYLQALGCHQSSSNNSNATTHTIVRVFAENYCDYAPTAKLFDRVVGVFCTPPNSYSGIGDPIDLICSRGGDLNMLEVLTESEMSDDSKVRVAQILEQQREALRLTLARPQVQFCLYETHSVVDAENASMVRRAVELMNRCAHVRHVKLYRDRRRLEMLAEAEGVSVDQLEKLYAMNTPAMAAAKKKLREMEVQDDARAAAGAAAMAANALAMAAAAREGSSAPQTPVVATTTIVVEQHDDNNDDDDNDDDSSAENSGNEDNDEEIDADGAEQIPESDTEPADDPDSENETLNTARSKRSQHSPTASPYLAVGGDNGAIKVPKTDLFETVPIPDVCAFQDGCLQLAETGCFLSLIKRKRVTRMDEKYLIVMAERRGLFGDTSPTKRPKVKPAAKSKKDLDALKKKQQQQLLLAERPKSQQRCDSADIERLIDRLLTPTYAVSRQYFVAKKSRTDGAIVRRRADNVCERACFGRRETAESGARGVIDEADMYRMWWRQTLQFIRRYHVVNWMESGGERRRRRRSSRRTTKTKTDDGGDSSDGDDDVEAPVLVLQRPSNVRTLYRCVMKNIVFSDNKSV